MGKGVVKFGSQAVAFAIGGKLLQSVHVLVQPQVGLDQFLVLHALRFNQNIDDIPHRAKRERPDKRHTYQRKCLVGKFIHHRK